MSARPVLTKALILFADRGIATFGIGIKSNGSETMRCCRIVYLVTASLLLFWLLPAKVIASTSLLTIGIPLVQTEEQTLERWQPLADYLNQQVESDLNFTIKVLNLDELETAVATGGIDFLFVNPSLYVNFSYRYGLTSPLATLVNQEQGYNLSEFAGVIFVRSDREDIAHFEDLKGKVVAIPTTQSLAAYQMQAIELKRRGIHPQTDLTLLELGLPLTNTLEAVMSREADAGFMRAGVLETWKEQALIAKSSYRILEPRQYGGFPWVTSTALYPEWPFAALAHTDPQVVRYVTAALLNLPLNSITSDALGIAGFTIPGDYRGIDRLLRDLQIAPFDHVIPLTFKQIWAQWQFVGWLVLLSVALVTITALIFLKRKNDALAISHLNNAVITQQLQENEALLNHAQQVACIGSWEFDLASEYYNCTDQLCLMFGIAPDQKLTVDDFIKPVIVEDRPTVEQAWVVAKKTGSDYEIDYRIHVNNELRWVHEKLHVIKNAQGKKIKLMGTVQDVTEKIAYERHVESLAFNDTLTNIPNRSWLEKELNEALTDKSIKKRSMLLILLNIDRFNTINNALGSRFGDALLKAVGHRLQTCQLGEATIKVARMAGDEFAILIHSSSLANMDQDELELFLSDHCKQMFSTPFSIEDEPVSVSVSTGAVCFPDKALLNTADQIFQRANMALAFSRREGGGQLNFYQGSMSKAVDYHYKLELDLKRAVEKDELQLFMQPQFDASGNKVAAEILLRWKHSELGMISPFEFIPIAEATNMIGDIDHWVMRQACALIKQARNRHIKLKLAVNISPRHFCKESFVPWLKQLLREEMVDAECFILEVTEGVFLHNIDSVTDKMHELRKLGLQFSIDDFGTGYSSLAYLKRLPVNEIKIDKSFVQDAPKDAEDAALIEAIFAVAEKMQLRVVAEGVETFEQADFLKERSGTILYQGYLFGRPAPVADWLEKWRESSLPCGEIITDESDPPKIQ